MLDRNYIRENLSQIGRRLKTKNFAFDTDSFARLDEKERATRVEWEELRALRNKTSDDIAQLKKNRQEAGAKIEEMKKVSTRIKELDEENRRRGAGRRDFLAVFPTRPS